MTNTYTLDEGGNMIDHNHNGIDFAALREWVINMSAEYPMIFWDWKLDDQLINYNYPVHSVQYVGGWAITYIPDHLNPNNGFISGVETAYADEIVTVTKNPDWCYDMISCVVDLGDEILDISSTMQFTMPDNPVTVTAEFAPKNWTLTVNYLLMDGTPIPDADPSVYPMMHVDDEILVDDYAAEFADYELITDDETINQDDVMECGDKVVNYYYQGKMHEITFCENDTEYEVNYTTDPEGEARYGETVTLTVETEDGVSIMGVTITDMEGNTVPYEGSNGVFTFVMR